MCIPGFRRHARWHGGIGLFVIVGVLLAGPSAALEPERRISQFSLDSWRSDDGLPQISILSLVQTRDGYMWLGTWEGLVRFDGARFVVFDNRNTPELRNHTIKALAEDSQGTLWVGTAQGLVAYHDGRFERAPGAAALLNDAMVEKLLVGKGNLWVGTSGGLWQVPLGEGTAHQYTAAQGLPSSHVTALAHGEDGSLWVGTKQGLARIAIDELKAKPFSIPGPNAQTEVTALFRGSAGVLWVGTTSGLVSWNGMSAQRFTINDGLPDTLITALYTDTHGTLWVGTQRGGLVRHTVEGFSEPVPGTGLVAAEVMSLLEDRDGHLWVGTYSGLFRLRDGPFATYGMAEGLDMEGTVSAVLEDRRGTMWIGTVGAGMYRLVSGHFRHVSEEEGLTEKVIIAVHEGSDGTLWVGTIGGLYRYDGTRFTKVPRELGGPQELVTAILQDSRGDLWVGTTSALLRIHEGNATSYGPKQGLTHPVIVIAEDRERRVWFGSETGLLRWEDGKGFRHYTQKDGLPGDLVLSLLADEDGTLWVGTEEGLGRWRDETWERFTMQQGLNDDAVFSLLPDADGHLWMSSNMGVSRVSRRELEEVAEGKITKVTSLNFEQHDGMRSAECNGNTQPSGWKAKDGRLWFANLSGAIVVDPVRVTARRRSPEVRIEEVRVQGKPVPVEGRVELPPGGARLEIRFTAFWPMDAARLTFRYRLQGHDDGWVNAEVRMATYTGLRPGNYRFEVQATGRDGAWSDPVVLDVVLEPRLWQRTSFWLLCVLGTGLMGLTAYFLRQSVRSYSTHSVKSNNEPPPVAAHDSKQTAPANPHYKMKRPEHTASTKQPKHDHHTNHVRILHISDIHFRSTEGAQPESRIHQVKREEWKRHRVLGEAWARNLNEIIANGAPIDFVCLTGDIADWGLPQEYARATHFLGEILSRLSLGRDRIFVIPGNHDIQRNTEQKSWSALRDAATQVPPSAFSNWMAGGPAPFGVDASLRDLVLRRRSAYHDWVEKELNRHDLLPSHSPHGRLGYRAKLHLPALPFPIHIIGLDSAWLAGDDHDAGKLRITEDQVGLLATDSGKPLDGLRIALTHHPLTDLADGVDTRRLLAERVDILLRGHQHETLSEVWVDPERRLLELAAGCLYEGGEGHRFPNAFQIIDITTDRLGRPVQYDILLRGWSPRGGHWFNDGSLYRNAPSGRISIRVKTD